MSSTINALTSGGGLAMAGDTSGQLAFQKDGTTFATGNQYGIGLGTAVPSSGIGIAFPATQSASSDANTLDDYEEGTWTPAITGWSSITYSGRSGQYTKVGNMVTCWFNIVLTAGTSSASFITITGLPFSSSSNYGGSTNYSNLQVSETSYYPPYPNGTAIYFYNFASGNQTTSNANIAGNRYLQGMVTYTV
jgi:hypothetical protein